MNQLGGTYPLVIGQPPHLAMQSLLPASMTAPRASSTARFAPQSAITLSGKASRICARSSFPVGQRSQYAFGISTPFHKPHNMSAASGGDFKVNPVQVDYFAAIDAANIRRNPTLVQASEALARPLGISIRPVPVGAGRVDQVRNPFVAVVFSAFQRGSL